MSRDGCGELLLDRNGSGNQDSGDTRGFFNAAKAAFGPSYRRLNPLHTKDGQELLKDESINA